MIYVVAVVVIAMLALVAYLVHAVLGATKDQLASRDLYEKQREQTDQVIADRDHLTEANATLIEKTKTLQDRLSIAESQRNDATRALAAKVADGIKNAATPDAALAALNDILRAHLPGTGPAAAGGDGGEAAAVQPAGAAPAVPAPGGGHA